MENLKNKTELAVQSYAAGQVYFITMLSKILQDSVRLLWYAYWTRMLRPFYFAKILAFSPLLGPARSLEFNQNFLPAHKS